MFLLRFFFAIAFLAADLAHTFPPVDRLFAKFADYIVVIIVNFLSANAAIAYDFSLWPAINFGVQDVRMG